MRSGFFPTQLGFPAQGGTKSCLINHEITFIRLLAKLVKSPLDTRWGKVPVDGEWTAPHCRIKNTWAGSYCWNHLSENAVTIGEIFCFSMPKWFAMYIIQDVRKTLHLNKLWSLLDGASIVPSTQVTITMTATEFHSVHMCQMLFKCLDHVSQSIEADRNRR